MVVSSEVTQAPTDMASTNPPPHLNSHQQKHRCCPHFPGMATHVAKKPPPDQEYKVPLLLPTFLSLSSYNCVSEYVPPSSPIAPDFMLITAHSYCNLRSTCLASLLSFSRLPHLCANLNFRSVSVPGCRGECRNHRQFSRGQRRFPKGCLFVRWLAARIKARLVMESPLVVKVS